MGVPSHGTHINLTKLMGPLPARIWFTQICLARTSSLFSSVSTLLSDSPQTTFPVDDAFLNLSIEWFMANDYGEWRLATVWRRRPLILGQGPCMRHVCFDPAPFLLSFMVSWPTHKWLTPQPQVSYELPIESWRYVVSCTVRLPMYLFNAKFTSLHTCNYWSGTVPPELRCHVTVFGSYGRS